MKFKLIILPVWFLLLSACQQQESYTRLNGYTMGTTYQVTLKTDSAHGEQLKQKIDQRLEKINQLMSTYIDDSELSIFNASQETNCQKLSQDTLYVIKSALDISRQTRGKFDVTLAPLIEIWGFDKKQTNNQVPEQQLINQLLAQIGFAKITLKNDCVAKHSANLSINLSAIAKGYAVDEIAKLIEQQNIAHYLVEIGGEIANKGSNSKGKPWRIAIESASTEKRSIQRTLTPKGLGVATSGDYRNYFEKAGKRFSHTIDPTNGYPIDHQLASVTVLHPQTMYADALATAMMVMGPEESLKFANDNQLPVFMLVKDENGFSEVYSEAFVGYLK